MAKSDDGKDETGSPCANGSPSQIIYAWARDAPKLELPDGVGFKVGKDSPIKYIVLQVHYAHIDKFKGESEGCQLQLVDLGRGLKICWFY